MKTFSVCWCNPKNENKYECKTLYNLSSAKKLMKAKIAEGMMEVRGSITKVWANGDWEPCGEISLTSSNKTMIVNTRQKSASYC